MKQQYIPSENTVKYLQGELAIGEAELEEIQDLRAICSADLAMKQQELAAAMRRAQFKLQTDIRQCELRVEELTRQLYLWRVGESALYQGEIAKRNTWYYRIFVFILSLCGVALVFMELREVQELQRKRDNPPMSDEQRELQRRCDANRRSLEYLRSLSAPPETQEIRQIRSEVSTFTRNLAWYELQTASKEAAVKRLRRRLDSALASQTQQQSTDSASKGPQQHATSSHPSVDPHDVEEAELKARLARAQAQFAVAKALEAEALRRMQGDSQSFPFSPSAYRQLGPSPVAVNPNVIDATEYAILEGDE